MTVFLQPMLMALELPQGTILRCAAEDDPSVPGGLPPDSPPPSPPGGAWRPGSSPLQELLNTFPRAAAIVRVPSLTDALNGVVEAHRVLTDNNSDGLVPQAMENMAASLAAFTDSDMSLITPASWTLVASGIFAAAQIVLQRGETPQSPPLTANVFKAAANFERFTHTSDDARGAVASENLFLNDRYLADALLSLKGWLAHDGLYETDERALGNLLARMGLASGAAVWPQRISGFSNLVGAVRTFLDGTDVSLLRKTRLLAPFVYFQAAAGWRPGSLGYRETMLSSVLDGDPDAKIQRLAEGTAKRFPNDPVVDRLCRAIRSTGDLSRMEIRYLAQAAVSPDTATVVTTLPDFLQLATTSIH